jgi:hypothetical protein
MDRLEDIKKRLAAAEADHISAPAPGSKTYTPRQAREDIAWLIAEIGRLSEENARLRMFELCWDPDPFRG